MWLFLIIIVVVIVTAILTEMSNDRKIEAAKKQQNQVLNDKGITTNAEYEWKGTINNPGYYRLVVDDNNQMLYFFHGESTTFDSIPYNKIIGFEIHANNKAIGGIGRAVVGGVIAGGAGAVVGAVTAKEKITSYKAIIYLEDIQKPKYEISLIVTKVNVNSIDFSKAKYFSENLNATIKAIIAKRNRETKTSNGSNVIVPSNNCYELKHPEQTEDIVQKLTQIKAAYDSKLISEEEYNAKKNELLNRL